MKNKSQFEKLATQVELENLQHEKARMKRKSMEARALVQSITSSQRLPDYLVLRMEKITWLHVCCDLRDILPLWVSNAIREPSAQSTAN